MSTHKLIHSEAASGSLGKYRVNTRNLRRKRVLTKMYVFMRTNIDFLYNEHDEHNNTYFKALGKWGKRCLVWMRFSHTQPRVTALSTCNTGYRDSYEIRFNIVNCETIRIPPLMSKRTTRIRWGQAYREVFVNVRRPERCQDTAVNGSTSQEYTAIMSQSELTCYGSAGCHDQCDVIVWLLLCRDWYMA